MIKHWLYGEINLNKEIQEESNCSKCLHNKICREIINIEAWERLCINYEFGTSQYRGCGGCLHRYSRWDKDQPILCFKCKHFKRKSK